jgi:carboxylesterase type B
MKELSQAQSSISKTSNMPKHSDLRLQNSTHLKKAHSLTLLRPDQHAPKDSKLPVVVHIYGGGVIKGSAYDPHFNPDKLLSIAATNQKPVIYVAMNYRVTIFGFVRLPILKEHNSLNLGMRDQRAAFDWIRTYISAFGGDPNKVTSFGTSSGGTFSSLQLMAYGGERGVPFNQIWSMSGPPGTAINITSDITVAHTLAVSKRLNCGGDLQDEERLLECIRNVPMEKLLDVAMAYSRENHPPLGLFTFIPSVDDDFIPGRTTALYESGRFSKSDDALLTNIIDD